MDAVSQQQSLFEDAVEERFQRVSADAIDKTKILSAESGSRPGRAGSLMDRLQVIASEAGFEAEGLLGRGGMGAVLLARDNELGRRVALKFMLSPEGANNEAVRMFRREAERASSLAHENTVQVYSWQSVGKLTFFVMEFVDGENLQQYVQREFRISVPEILRILAEASSGVAAAHDAGILHRDIKPQNILISNQGRVKVADFGLSSTTEEMIEGREPMIAGTLGFMAPEQARGEKATPASDVYSLAATLYYALARVAPYGSLHSTQMLFSRNREGKHIPLEQVKKGLPSAVYELVEAGLSPDPAHRPQDARAFRRALEGVLLRYHEEEPKLSLRDRLPEWTAQWLAWRPLLVGAIAGLTLGIVGTIVTMYLTGILY